LFSKAAWEERVSAVKTDKHSGRLACGNRATSAAGEGKIRYFSKDKPLADVHPICHPFNSPRMKPWISPLRSLYIGWKDEL
jgi:hypothetical protein